MFNKLKTLLKRKHSQKSQRNASKGRNKSYSLGNISVESFIRAFICGMDLAFESSLARMFKDSIEENS